MKTHNVVEPACRSRISVFGAPIKDKGFTLYNEDISFSPAKAKESKPGTVSYKRAFTVMVIMQ